MDDIKIFMDYKSFFNFINNFNGELNVTIGGELYFKNELIAKLIYKKNT